MEIFTGRGEIVEVHSFKDGVWKPFDVQVGYYITGHSLAKLIIENPEMSHVETVGGNPNGILFYDVAFNEVTGKPMHRRGRLRKVPLPEWGNRNLNVCTPAM